MKITFLKYLCVAFTLFWMRGELSAQWIPTSSTGSLSVGTLFVYGGSLFAGTPAGVYLLSDSGATWKALDNGLSNVVVRCFASVGSNLFVGTDEGVFVSTNAGDEWTETDSGMTRSDIFITALASNGDTLYAGTGFGKIYRSTNHGIRWATVDTLSAQTSINAFAFFAGSVFVGSSIGVLKSSDGVTGWSTADSGLQKRLIKAFTVLGDTLYLATLGKGVYRSLDSGATWDAIDTGLTNLYVASLTSHGPQLYAGVNNGGLFLSTDAGATWTPIGNGSGLPYVSCIANSDSGLFIGGYGTGVARSTNNGALWTPVNNGFVRPKIEALVMNDGVLFAGSPDNGIYFTTDLGLTWKSANAIFDSLYSGVPNVRALASISGKLFAGTERGLFRSTDGGTAWLKPDSGMSNVPIASLTANGNALYATGYSNGVFRSIDFGSHWSEMDSGIDKKDIRTFAVLDTILFAGSYRSGVFRSTNQGAEWAPCDTGLSSSYIFDFVTIDSLLFAGFECGGLFRSSNAGTTWKKVNQGFLDDCVWSVGASNGTLLAGVYSEGIYISTDRGDTWHQASTGLPYNTSVSAYLTIGNEVYVGTTVGVWHRPLAELITDVKGSTNSSSTQFELASNYPNPFASRTTINFDLNESKHVSLKIYNALGEEIAQLLDETVGSGPHSQLFNGESLKNGVYWYRLVAGSYSRTGEMTIAR